jgi:Uma2 family endonuclease
MASPAEPLPQYADLLALPENVVGEIVDGELHVSPRPALLHAAAASVLGAEVGTAFHRGRGGPGGWIILDEPELHLGPDVLVPDMAGWRRERLPELPDAPYLELAPDWVCEVMSASTALLDRHKKMPVYAREKVAYVWLVDPRDRLLELFKLEGQRFTSLGTHAESEQVRAEPFDAIELDPSALWAR